MKSWFTKRRISNAIDCGKNLPAALQKQIAGSAELKRFSQDVEQLEHMLRETQPPMGGAPANLHTSIMFAVRNQATRSPKPPAVTLLRWLPAPALAAVLIWAIIYFGPARPDPAPEAFASTISSLKQGMELAQTTPHGVIAPLSEEWNRLSRDVEQAKAFLMASLP